MTNKVTPTVNKNGKVSSDIKRLAGISPFTQGATPAPSTANIRPGQKIIQKGK